MPAAHPRSAGDPPASRKLLRTLVGTGLTAAVIAVAVALPDRAAAEPSLGTKLDTVSAQLKGAKSQLSELKEQRAGAHADQRSSQTILDKAPHSVTEAVDAVGEVGQSPIERLSALSGYSSSASKKLAKAADDVDDAQAQIKQLSNGIDDQEEKVDKLTDTRDDLLEEIAEAKAKEEEEKDNAVSGGGNDSPDVSSDGDGAVAFAKAQLGDSYVFGATGPDSWDCSSLTQAAWAAAGESIGRDTYAQWGAMAHIERSQLQPGDLVFYNGQGHVAMFIGGGQVIHAPQPGEVVKHSSIDMMGIDGYARP